MKKNIASCLAIVCVCILFSCATTKQSEPEDTERAFNGYATSKDAYYVADTFVKACADSGVFEKFYQAYGRRPSIVSGYIKNEGDENIDTTLFTLKMEEALGENKTVEVISCRDVLTDKIQFTNSDEEKKFAAEKGADLVMTGSVKTIVETVNGRDTRTYFCKAELVDALSRRVFWSAQNDEVKKVIRRSAK